MIVDYCEREEREDGLTVYVGLQFEDEPDSLYVAEFAADERGQVQTIRLLFNGFDCKYAFRPEEREQLQAYLREQGLAVELPPA